MDTTFADRFLNGAKIRRWVWPLSIILISLLAFLLINFTARQLKVQGRKDLEKTLSSVLNVTQAGLRLWKEDLQADHESLALLPKIRQLVEQQIQHPRQGHAQESFRALQEVLRPWIRVHGYLGFSIFTKDRQGKARPLFEKAPGYSDIFAESESVINNALDGVFGLGQPAGSNTPNLVNSDHKTKVVMISATPIRRSNGETIAALVFLVDVYGAFTDVTQLGRIGNTGETYVVNRTGQMVTRSRFDASSADSGPHLLEIRTRMADSLRNGESGEDLDGYRDYRGTDVVGIWTWDQNLGLGLATEIDKSEAYRSYEMIQKLLWVMIGIVTLAMFAFLIFREARTRNLRKIFALQQSDQARKELLAVVSHDLKNPLGSLLMTNELLLKTLPDGRDFTEKRKKLLERSRHAAEKMRRLITDLLDSAKIEAGKLEIHPIECTAKDVLDQTLEMFEPIIAEKSLRLTCDLPDNLPALLADPERLSQIFSNLVGNAVKFTDPGGQITIRAAVNGNWMQFSVIDSGTGILKEDLPHLFERYWQAKKTQSFGTGLGLAICNELVSAHGGKIWVESEIAKGTAFHFTMPLYSSARPGLTVLVNRFENDRWRTSS